MNINEITTQSSIARNDINRHPELVSGSQLQVRGVFSRTNKTLSRISKFTLFPKKFNPLPEVEGKCAFTLAEVLITLGIIGVVAVLTLPSIVYNIQKVVLKNQFKRAYSNFYNAIKYTQIQNGGPYACFYWTKNPYGDYICIKKNENGTCEKRALKDGSSLPEDYNGKYSDCKKFTEDLMKTLKTVKFCETKPLENGCITANYRGIDKVLEELYPDEKPDLNRVFSDKQIKEQNPTFITADGILYSKYANMIAFPYFMMDVNGHKGPNKWGYDIFWFSLHGDDVNGITKIEPVNSIRDKGGMTVNEILSGKK